MKNIKLSHYPSSPGVYIFKDKKGNILYIGKAKNLKKRISQYFSPGSIRKQEMVQQATDIEFMIVENESESLYLESNLIKKHLPPFNNMLKGSNAYTYIKITNHKIPQIFITRKKINDGSIYIGPKHHTKELKKFLQYLRQIVQYRTCPLSQFNQGKLCSDYYFGLCKGRCINKKTKDIEYPKLIVNFFKGNTKPIEIKIKTLINEAIKTQNFERAAKLRDIHLQIGNFIEKQSIEFAKSFSGYLLQIRELGSRRAYTILHFYEGKIIDIIQHHFEKEEIDQDTMLASFIPDFGKFNEEKGRYSTIKYPWKKEEKKNMLHLFDKFFESYLLMNSIKGTNIMNDLLQTLQKRYHFQEFPYHMECLDISHLGGDWTSGGISATIGGLSDKKHYRKFKITNIKNNDYLSLKEVIKKRFKLGEKIKEKKFLETPDVFILDGGKGQLGIINELIKEFPDFQSITSKTQFCALGKGEARKKASIGKKSEKTEQTISEKLYIRKNGDIIKNDLIYDDADKILIKLRNEAHRFSNAYRKKQEEMAFNNAKKRIEQK